MASVIFENASRVFANTGKGARAAVDKLNLEIADGEFLVLVGPSGCGKSTTLRMLAGLEPTDEGRILIGGEDATGIAPRDRDVAMVFQNYALYPNMTVAENMAFALRNRGVSKTDAQAKVLQAAKMLALEDLLDRKPAQLSGGQRQRVAMGRAIVREPAVFCMDEPLSNLDAKLRVSTRSQISSLQKRLHTTTVYVTHDQVEAMTMGDRVAVMNDGVLQQVDTPRAIYDRPCNFFVASFIGAPAMNFFHIHHRPNWLPEHLGAPRQDYILGVRSEDWEIQAEESTHSLALVISHVEELGSESFAYCQIAKTADAQLYQSEESNIEGMVAVCLQRGERRAVGETMYLTPTRTHHFDRATGQRLDAMNAAE